MSNIKYSIICCYYNEINVLKKKFIPFIDKVKNFPFTYEIFFCDNNSQDGSREFLQEMENKKIPHLNFIYNDQNLGKGGSIKKCINISNGEFITIFDIDK